MYVCTYKCQERGGNWVEIVVDTQRYHHHPLTIETAFFRHSTPLVLATTIHNPLVSLLIPQSTLYISPHLNGCYSLLLLFFMLSRGSN
jgi:hypothetical protein